MNTYSSPSAYRYCIVRLSTVAVSTLVPALNVLSTTLPESTFFSVVRTNAPPLPGLTCWNSTTDHSSPSRLRTSPFFRSFVVAITCPAHRNVIWIRQRTRQVYRFTGPGLGLAVLAVRQVLQGQPVPVDAQPADDPGGDGGDHRVVPELL